MIDKYIDKETKTCQGREKEPCMAKENPYANAWIELNRLSRYVRIEGKAIHREISEPLYDYVEDNDEMNIQRYLKDIYIRVCKISEEVQQMKDILEKSQK